MKHRFAFKCWLTGFTVWVTLGLSALMVLMVNYLASHHPLRFDVSRTRHYALTAETKSLLDHLPADIRIVVFMSGEHELYRDVQSLLREYTYASARLLVEYVDPHRDMVRSKELALQYDLREPNVIVLDAGGKRRIVPVADLADYDYTPTLAGRAKVLRRFCGEQALSTALQGLLQVRKPVVYFLTGHGERQTDNFDPYTGYSIIARTMEKNNLEIKPLSFSGVSAVPGDGDALIIAGPTKRLTHLEVEMIKAYLNNHGRLLLLVDPGLDSGLEEMLELWGMRLGSDRVVSSATAGRQLLVTAYGEHPITTRLKNVTTIFTMPRSVQPLVGTNGAADKPADKPRVAVLASSSDQGWAELSVNQNPPKFDPGVDQPGPVPVAVAIEKGPVPGMEVELQPTRLVIIGDSVLVANGALLGGYNSDFFMNALNWLLERKETLTIASREPAMIQVALDRGHLRRLSALVVVGLPGLVVLLGLMVWAHRRK
ncbi:MAG: GldG family protein [Verrucomicrobia bacterium]|nr:GldG family protein [Verrucomicrobiota bacterium]MBU1736074.1 GldG family protein [Verrucomicrobiota bacterium]MBU1857636.1 GldG family protein [Verrucomicrobiota bacterium]